MFNCSNIYSVWDKRLIRGVKNYRREAKSVEYKGTRDTEKNKKVFQHEDVTTQLLNSMGVKNMYPGILEADDVIAWLSKNIEGKVTIVSVDQDMLQLVDGDTSVYSPIKDVYIQDVNFEEVTGVPVSQFLRYKSLMGDKSDNLPGIPKCGPVTAQKLVTKYPDDTSLVESLGAEKLQPYYTNKRMIDLNQGVIEHPDDLILYEKQYNELEDHKPDLNEFKKLCESLNIKNITTKINEWESVFFKKQLYTTLESIVNKLQIDK